MNFTNIYPPIVDTYAPTFELKNLQTICKIYFSLSPYNAFTDLQKIKVQVRLTNQFNNKSVLTEANGLKVCDIKKENENFYIEILNQDIKNGFNNNIYYAAQLRFYIPTENVFSEWSTICLVRGISTPSLSLIEIKDTSKEQILNKTNLSIIGKLEFQSAEEKEQLQSYQIKLYTQDNVLLIDSDILYPQSINALNYTLKYLLENQKHYKLIIKVITDSSFTFEKTYLIHIQQSQTNVIPAKISAQENISKGSIDVYIDPLEVIIKNIIIQRSSSKTNFLIWEDVNTVNLKDHKIHEKYIWEDKTVESGIWYKYSIQTVEKNGQRNLSVILRNPILILLNDAFLLANSKQLKLKFDMKIPSLKQVVLDSKIDTLGSPYPFIKRNGTTNYKQFSISGTIASEMDDKKDFLSKESLYENQDILTLYNNFNLNNNISEYNDFIYEKEFRDNVLKFLHEDNVKLFRSATEGNILVRLMDINLTPNAALGRRIYSFTATAYEIDEYSFENLYKYNIVYNDIDKEV